MDDDEYLEQVLLDEQELLDKVMMVEFEQTYLEYWQVDDDEQEVYDELQ